MTTRVEIEVIPDANVDETEETLIAFLEFVLVEYLDADHRRFRHGSIEGVSALIVTAIWGIRPGGGLHTVRMSRSNWGSESS